jgi:hypothetical protein
VPGLKSSTLPPSPSTDQSFPEVWISGLPSARRNGTVSWVPKNVLRCQGDGSAGAKKPEFTKPLCSPSASPARVVSPIQQSSRLGFQPRHCITITFDPLPLPSDVLGCMPVQLTDINWRVRPADCDNVTRLWPRVRVLGRFDGRENNAW